MRLARLALAALVLLPVLPPAARAASAPSPEALLRRMAAPWPGLQRADGTFPDAVIARTGPAGRDPYGTAMMGYGLLAAGVRVHNDAMVGAGLRALGQAAAHPAPDHLIFEGLALASGYTLAARSVPRDPRFTAVRPAWAARLRAVRVLQIGKHAYSNWDAVEAVELLELARSGVRRDAATLRRVAFGVMDHAVPRMLARGGILSDPPWEPLAYHAFTTALLARARAVAGLPVGRTVRRAVAATAALMSPSGDVAYLGRSDGEAWTLTMTAAAARADGRPDLAARALTRLRAEYLGGPRGFRLTPSGSVPALDTYAATVPYSGLALVGLAWAADASARARPVAASRSAILGGANGRFAVVRTPTVWFAVKEQPGRAIPGRSRYARDLRFDAGLAALERHTETGWHALLPARPRTTSLTDAAALTLVRHGRRGRLSGTRIALADRGRAAVVAGTWRTSGGGRAGAARVSYTATTCGVGIRIETTRGDRVRLVLRSRSRSPSGPARLAGARVTRGAAEASSSDARVYPFAYAITAKGGHVDATVCPGPPAASAASQRHAGDARDDDARADQAQPRHPLVEYEGRERGADDDARLANGRDPGRGCERQRREDERVGADESGAGESDARRGVGERRFVGPPTVHGEAAGRGQREDELAVGDGRAVAQPPLIDEGVPGDAEPGREGERHVAGADGHAGVADRDDAGTRQHDAHDEPRGQRRA